MIYRILCSGVDIYSTTLDNTVLSPTLELELNSAGSLTFTLPAKTENNSDIWNLPTVFSDEIDVYEDGEIIWFGRPLQVTRDWNNQKKVVCEGALAYFNDTIQRPTEYSNNNTVLYEDQDEYPGKTGFFNSIIDIHNSQVEENRKIFVGNIDIDNSIVSRSTDYTTTSDCLQQMCLDTNGGYFILRKELDDGVYKRYIDWVKDMPGVTDQPAQFGLNLLDLSQDLNGADICTVLIPTGADGLLVNAVETYDETNPSPYDIDSSSSVYTGQTHTFLHVNTNDEIVHKEGYEKYGRVLKQKDWGDVTDKNVLFQYAADWLRQQNEDIPTIECSAADLHYLDKYSEEMGRFKVGQKVQVSSGPHDLSKFLPIYKLSMQLDTGIKKMTIGTPPKRELTDITSSSGGSTRSSSSSTSSSGSSSGGGSVNIPVKDVKVKKPGETKFKTVVSKKVAEIDLSELGSGKVTDVQVNGSSVLNEDGVANVVVPDIPNIPVKDVQVDESSIVDENGIVKLNSSDFGTTVVPNPSEEATDDLNSIQIGDDIFNIAGTGGSGGKQYTCDLLFVNDPLPSPASGTSYVTRTYKLNRSIDDYDAVYVLAYTYYESSTKKDIFGTSITLKKDYYIYNNASGGSGFGGFIINGSSYDAYRRLMYKFPDNVTISTRSDRNNSANESMLYKVYGLKFAASVINNPLYLSTIYDDTEKQVGWYYGKPLYQKSFKFENLTIGSWITAADVRDLSIDRCYNIFGTYYRSWGTGGASESYTTIDDNNYKGVIRVKNNTHLQYYHYYNNNNQTIPYAHITIQYTKTTDSVDPNPQQGNIIYLPTIYSEEERQVGVWTDGKPLYQKTWFFDEQVEFSNGWDVILNNVTIPFDMIVFSHGYQYDHASLKFGVWFDESSNALKAKSLRQSSYEYIDGFTLQYTKTTDTPYSGSWLPDGSKAHQYSTVERPVGTWIDGSVIYERTISGGITFSSQDTWYDTPITNINNIIDFNCHLKRNDEQIGDSFNAGNVNYIIRDNVLKIKIYGMPSSDTYTLSHLTVKYTKST